MNPIRIVTIPQADGGRRILAISRLASCADIPASIMA